MEIKKWIIYDYNTLSCGKNVYFIAYGQTEFVTMYNSVCKNIVVAEKLLLFQFIDNENLIIEFLNTVEKC